MRANTNTVWRSFEDRRNLLQALLREKRLIGLNPDMQKASVELRALYPRIEELEKEITILRRVIASQEITDGTGDGEQRSGRVEYRFAVGGSSSSAIKEAPATLGHLLKLRGYAVLWNELSADLGGFREQFAPTAFDASLADDSPKLFLIEHKPPALASTRTDDLTLTADREGLHFEARLDRRDELTSRAEPQLRARRAMSFAFISQRDKWENKNGQVIRTVVEAELLEVSAVQTPAYPQTTLTVSTRSNWEAEHEARERHLQLMSMRSGVKRPEYIPPALDCTIQGRLLSQKPEHRDKLRKLYAMAIANNQLYFGGKLKLPNILVKDLTRHNARAIYEHSKDVPAIAFNTRTLETNSDSSLMDTLLHEQIHQAMQLVGDKFLRNKGGWHHADFAKIANRIAKQRGWPDCSPDVQHGLTAARHWPPTPHK